MIRPTVGATSRLSLSVPRQSRAIARRLFISTRARYALFSRDWGFRPTRRPQAPLPTWANSSRRVFRFSAAGVPLDKSEGPFKGTPLLGGARAPLISPEKVEDQG